MFLKAWQIHPKASRIEKTKETHTNPSTPQWFGPHLNPNKTGFWLYSPIEIDFTYRSNKFEIHEMENYGSEDYEKTNKLLSPSEKSDVDKWCLPKIGKTKTTIGLVEKNLIQIWTGLVFETPPGWCLHIKSPANFPKSNMRIMEVILETDRIQCDAWINVFCSEGRSKITKNAPLAQIVPIKREAFNDWILLREEINRSTPEADKVFRCWLDYNKQNKMSDASHLFTQSRKTLEEELKEYEDSHPKPDYVQVFDKDISESMKIIGSMQCAKNSESK